MDTELLQAILDELKAQGRSEGSTPLGFGNPPRARYIYANRQYPDCLWYFWNGGKSIYEPI